MTCASRSRPGHAALLLLVLSGGRLTAADVTFGRDILPILSDNCFRCHGPDAGAHKAGLRLDTESGALRKTDAMIVPGRSEDSELIRRITSGDPEKVMPPPTSNRKLTPRESERLRAWIDGGARWGKHWAFETPRVTSCETPSVRDRSWARNAIDRFVLARLEAERLRPSAEAPRETLIRRVTLDLTGLPPTPQEVDTFVGDTAPDAYERVVDRLLASPHYGERMVWEWLDAARYADSNGYQGDAERTMWPWRDWVVGALNRNLPFDQFTVWQLAGDLLPGATTEQKLATAFCRNHMINGEGGRIPEENRVEYVMDMTETTATVWLGLTLNCCRCHDHKFDPLLHREYYQLFAYFNQTPITGGGGDPQGKPVIEMATPEHATKLAGLGNTARAVAKEVDDQEAKLFPRSAGQPASTSMKAAGIGAEIVAILKEKPGNRGRGQTEKLEKEFETKEPAYAALLKKQRAAIEARDNYSRSIPRVMVMEDMPKPRDTFILTRGSYEKPGQKVEAGLPAALFTPRTSVPGSPEMPRNRLGLARWLVSADNPLTARVTVNRAWQQFFGIGLVKTPEDFGVQGEKPSHPELLDWLAVDFVASGWDVKRLHRLIVTSATYRQSSVVSRDLQERDPQNRLLARGPRFRMPSWMIRDQALAASGLLVRMLGGPPVKPYQPPGIWEEATFGTKRYQQDQGAALYRRSVYTFWRRIIGPTEIFDSAARQTCIVKPTRTNTPLHALTTLNDVTYVEAARALAERVLMSAGPSDEERVELAFRLVLARRPKAEEKKVLLGTVARVRREFTADPTAAKKLLTVGESKRNRKLDAVEHATFAALCTAILNLDEALTKE
jgi:hypothetical protein